MSKKKKYILITFLALLILLIFSFLLIIVPKDKVRIDLISLKSTIEEIGDYNLSNMKDLDKDFIINDLGINEEYFETYIGKIPLIYVSASMYVVIEASSNENADYILDKLDEFTINFENSWTNYLLSEYNIVKNRKIGRIGNYIYLLIVENSEELERELIE